MNSLVNISEGTSLAIHGLGLLADIAPGRINVKAAAENLRASEAHLAKVFGKLQKSGLVSSTRGQVDLPWRKLRKKSVLWMSMNFSKLLLILKPARWEENTVLSAAAYSKDVFTKFPWISTES